MLGCGAATVKMGTKKTAREKYKFACIGGSRFSLFDKNQIFDMINLTGQPEGECDMPLVK